MKAGWQTKTLDQIAENLDSKRIPITKSDRKSGEYPYYGASGIVDYVADYIFDVDTLLISEDGANLLARSTPIAFPASGKYWVNNHAHILKFDNMTNQRFVELYLESIPLDEYITGAAQPKLNQKALNSIPIPYPPLPEQKRIVDILDETFESIATAKANAEKNLLNARAIFDSHLQGVFTQSHEGWVEKSLSELCDIKHGFAFDGEDFSSDVAECNPLVITPGNFTEGCKLLFNKKNTKRFNGDIPSGFLFDIGDLVVVMTDLSSKMKILGKPAFVETDNVLHNQRIGRVIFNNDSIAKRFVYYFMMSEGFLKNIKKSSTGTMVKHTAPKRILSNVIKFPHAKEVQLSIVSKLDELAVETQRLESIYQLKLSALDALKKSLLDQAFTGQL